MKNKRTYSILIGFVISACSTFAAEVATCPATSISTKEVTNSPSYDEILERLTALENKQSESTESKKPSWFDNVKIKGDLRYRFEQVEKDDETSKNRQRIRVRLGAYAQVNDFTTAGIRLRSNQGANSGNQTIGNDFDAKGTYFDLAYMTIAPEDAKYGAATVGKMKYPWKAVTDLIWDGDVNPEGAAYTYSTKAGDTGIFGSAGYFKVQETSSTHDLNLASIQAGITQPISDELKVTLGASFFDYDNVQDFYNPNVDFGIAEVFAEVGVKDVLCVPFKFYGNIINNTRESSGDNGYCAGIKFGDAKKGQWEAKVGYRDLDEFAAPDIFADSDFAGGGTDIKGARVKAKYNIGKHLQTGITFIAGEQKSSDTDVNTLHIDLIASF